MSQLIARYNRLHSADKPSWPSEIAFWWTPDGKVRMNKRGRAMNIDRWFADFDEAAPVIQKLIDTSVYRLHTGLPPDPYDNLLFKGVDTSSYSRTPALAP